MVPQTRMKIERGFEQVFFALGCHPCYCRTGSTASKAIPLHFGQGAGTGIGMMSSTMRPQLEHRHSQLSKRSFRLTILSGGPNRSMMSFSSMARM